jgi:hypothetical protein
MGRAKKEDQISVRLDPKLRASLEEIKEKYGYLTDSDALRGLIQLIHNKDIIASEVEGRLLENLIPILEARLKKHYASDEFKELIRSIMDEVITDEEGQ